MNVFLKSSTLTSVIHTFLLQIIAIVFAVINLGLLVIIIDPELIGLYMIGKRFIAIMMPILTLNMAISLAKYNSKYPQKANQYFSYSLITIILLGIIFGVTVYLFQNEISILLFGDKKYVVLIMPLILFLYSNCFQIICTGYFRGTLNFTMMNMVHIFFHVLSFIILIILYLVNLDQYNTEKLNLLKIYFLAFSTLSIILNIIILVINDKSVIKWFYNNLKNTIMNLLNGVEISFFRYGIIRLVTGFSLSALFFIPVVLSAHLYSLKSAAQIGIIITIIRMLQTFVLPFNIVFLPKFSSLLEKSNPNYIRKQCQRIFEAIFSLPLLIGLSIYFISSELIELWLGNEFINVSIYINYLWPSITLFLVYVLIRAVIDGLYEYAYSNIITLSGLLGFIIVSATSSIYFHNIWSLIMAIGVGFSILGILSMVILIRIQNISFINLKNIIAMILGIITFFCIYIIKLYWPVQNLFLSFILKVVAILTISLVTIQLHRKVVRYNWIDSIIESTLGRKYY
ncbi:MAG: hypothetical protein ISS28_00755 [Candidatus Cloacimonetes bacterium]|nr:hypothetical protein [Candidatus Cloacimonadota bacterium]